MSFPLGFYRTLYKNTLDDIFLNKLINCKTERMLDKQKMICRVLVLALCISGCASVDKYNAQINTVRNEKDLKTDVDYIRHKLEKLHPDLYHYISKEQLDYKFDSLKSSLTGPMTSNEFFFKLSPVIASIKQGHTQTFPLTKKFKSTEKKAVFLRGQSPLNQFDLELFNNRLYIVKNNSKDSTIKAGTEIRTMNAIPPQDIIVAYKNTFTSDGYNTTFINRRLAKSFPRFFYYRYGVTDSIICQLNYQDSTRTVTLKRPAKPKTVAGKKPIEQTIQEKQKQKVESQKRRLQGYDALKKMYSKQLSFPTKDSSIAILRIEDFTKGAYKQFYKKSFQQLDSLHTKNLIIDLRDNTGGRLREIHNLYSYLADSCFHLVEKSEVCSKTSLWHLGYYNDEPLWQKVIQTALFPIVAGIDGYTYLKTKKGSDNKYRFAFKESRLAHPKVNCFKGKVYVLINGGCFSASCLLSSNLQGSKRAFFVGQETGGSDNGCVAGIMPVRTLPKSKLKVSFGLLVCKAPYQSKVDGRGIFPDVEITPTVQDRINGTDPELQWVLNDIKSAH